MNGGKHYYVVEVDQHTDSNDSVEIAERLEWLELPIRVALMATPDEIEGHLTDELIISELFVNALGELEGPA